MTCWAQTAFALFYVASPLLDQGQQANPDTQTKIVSDIDQTEQYRENHLAGYTVNEHYVIKNSHFQDPAEVLVRTEYKRGAGKTYQVVSRTGPSLLKDRVLDRILQEQRDMSRGEVRSHVLVTSSNYDFRLIGEGSANSRKCWVLEITPKFKSPHLLKGKVWVDYQTKLLVQIEGKPPASSSFFAGRPDILRAYNTVEGFALAQSSRAVSRGLIQGDTEVTIKYEGYKITQTP